MPTKSTKSANPDPRAGAVAAALRLAAKRDWAHVTMADIAKEAKMKLADLSQMFECREDILTAYGRIVDRDVLAAYPDGVPGASERDRLFDVLMERFDRLNNDRKGLVSILNACCADPKQAVISLPSVGRSMTWTLEACAIDTQGWRGALKITGLSAIYLWVLRTWKDDESTDMAKTMAALDRSLATCEKWSETIGF